MKHGDITMFDEAHLKRFEAAAACDSWFPDSMLKKRSAGSVTIEVPIGTAPRKSPFPLRAGNIDFTERQAMALDCVVRGHDSCWGEFPDAGAYYDAIRWLLDQIADQMEKAG